MRHNINAVDDKIRVICVVEDMKTYIKLLEYLYCNGAGKCYGFYSAKEFDGFCEENKNTKNMDWCIIEVTSTNLKSFGVVYLNNVVEIIKKIRNTFPDTALAILTNIDRDAPEIRLFIDNEIPVIQEPATEKKIKEICKLMRG